MLLVVLRVERSWTHPPKNLSYPRKIFECASSILRERKKKKMEPIANLYLTRNLSFICSTLIDNDIENIFLAFELVSTKYWAFNQ